MRSLKTLVALLTTSLVLLLLGGLGWLEDRQLGQDYARLLRQQQGTLTETVADDLDDRLTMHVAVLERLALAISDKNLNDQVAMHDLLVRSGMRPMFDAVGVLDLAGVMVATDATTRSALPAPVSLADRAYFKQVIQSGRPVTSPPLVSRTTGRPVVVLVVPVRDGQGRMVAVVGATLDLAHPNVLGRIAQARVGAAGHYVIVTRGDDSRYVVHPDPSRVLQPATGPAPNAEKAQHADVVTSGFIRGPDWELRAVLPASEAYAPLNAARERLYLHMALLALASGILAWFGSRVLIRPLERLLDAMRQLRQSPDAAVSLDLGGSDERGALAREFDALMRSLRERQAELAAMVEASPLGLFRADCDGPLLYANDTFLRIHGLTRESMARGWLGLVAPVSRERVWAEWIDIVAGQKPSHFERRMTRADGTELVVSIRTAPVIVDGRVVSHTGTVSDITDRVHAESAVHTLAAILDSTPDLVMQTGAQGNMIYMNPAARERNGLAPDAPINHLTFRDFNPPAMIERHRTEIVPTALERGVWVGEFEAVDLHGRLLPCAHTLIAHRDGEGILTHFSAIQRDISAEKEAADALHRQAGMLRTLADTMPELVAVVDRAQRYLFANQAFERHFSAVQGGLVGLHMREVLGEIDYARSQPYVERALTGATVVFEKESLRDTLPRRCFESRYTPVRAHDGSVQGLVVVGRDVTALRNEQSRLRDLAEKDPLTGLLNRAGFQARLEMLCQRAETGRGSLAVMYLDMDHFKEVNDTHGHGVGDELLRVFAKRLDHLVRPTDAVARLGGDEFAIALADVQTLANAERVADKLLVVAHEPFHIEHVTLRVGASVGLALWRPGDGDGGPLLQRADAMLYRAKQGGRGRRASAEALH